MSPNFAQCSSCAETLIFRISDFWLLSVVVNKIWRLAVVCFIRMYRRYMQPHSVKLTSCHIWSLLLKLIYVRLCSWWLQYLLTAPFCWCLTLMSLDFCQTLLKVAWIVTHGYSHCHHNLNISDATWSKRVIITDSCSVTPRHRANSCRKELCATADVCEDFFSNCLLMAVRVLAKRKGFHSLQGSFCSDEGLGEICITIEDYGQCMGWVHFVRRGLRHDALAYFISPLTSDYSLKALWMLCTCCWS